MQPEWISFKAPIDGNSKDVFEDMYYMNTPTGMLLRFGGSITFMPGVNIAPITGLFVRIFKVG